jgi:hypothetical protein
MEGMSGVIRLIDCGKSISVIAVSLYTNDIDCRWVLFQAQFVTQILLTCIWPFNPG